MAEKFNIFALFEHAYNFGLKFCSYFKNNVLSDAILWIFIMMWLSTINFTPVSVKIKFLWSSENDWKFNIFALFEHAYSFGLKFCSYFKNNVLSDSFLWIFIMMWSSTMNFTSLSVKIKFLWSSENGWNISFWGEIVSFFLFWGCFSYIHRQIAIFFFLISENIPQEVYKNGVWSKLPRGVIIKCEPEHGSKTHFWKKFNF